MSWKEQTNGGAIDCGWVVLVCEELMQVLMWLSQNTVGTSVPLVVGGWDERYYKQPS